MSLRGLPVLVSAVVILGLNPALAGSSDRNASVVKLVASAPTNALDTCAAGGGGGGGGGGGSGGSGGGSGGAGAASGAASGGAASAAPSNSGASLSAVGTTNSFSAPNGAGNASAVGGANGANGVGPGGGGGSVGGGLSETPSLQRGDRFYTVRAIYFRRESFKSTADCLTAAHAQHLPLEVCR